MSLYNLFALGAIANNKLMARLNQIKAGALISVAISGFLAITAVIWLNVAENPLLVPLTAMIGVSATIALAVLLDRLQVASFIKLWGLFSLQIYVVHTICTSGMRILLQKFLGFTEPCTHIVLGTIAGIYAPIALDWLCRQVKFPYLFTFRPKRIA